MSDIIFDVKQIGKRMVIFWQLNRIVDSLKDDDAKVETNGLTGYLYSVEQFNVFYEVVGTAGDPAPLKAKAELRWHGQGHGEYKRRLYWDARGHLFRTFPSTHYLTQHGLDGFPLVLYNFLLMEKPSVPLFRITHKRGADELSLGQWTQYFLSGHNEQDLADLVQAQLELPLF